MLLRSQIAGSRHLPEMLSFSTLQQQLPTELRKSHVCGLIGFPRLRNPPSDSSPSAKYEPYCFQSLVPFLEAVTWGLKKNPKMELADTGDCSFARIKGSFVTFWECPAQRNDTPSCLLHSFTWGFPRVQCTSLLKARRSHLRDQRLVLYLLLYAAYQNGKLWGCEFHC